MADDDNKVFKFDFDDFNAWIKWLGKKHTAPGLIQDAKSIPLKSKEEKLFILHEDKPYPTTVDEVKQFIFDEFKKQLELRKTSTERPSFDRNNVQEKVYDENWPDEPAKVIDTLVLDKNSPRDHNNRRDRYLISCDFSVYALHQMIENCVIHFIISGTHKQYVWDRCEIDNGKIRFEYWCITL